MLTPSDFAQLSRNLFHTVMDTHKRGDHSIREGRGVLAGVTEHKLEFLWGLSWSLIRRVASVQLHGERVSNLCQSIGAPSAKPVHNASVE